MLSIKGLKEIYIEELNKTLYFNQSMKNNGFIISSQTYCSEDRTSTIISVNHLNRMKNIEIDAAIYQLYEGPALVPIQEFQIIKTVYDLYSENSSMDFLEIIHGMSICFISASIQPEYENS
jgi:hypothetical protein